MPIDVLLASVAIALDILKLVYIRTTLENAKIKHMRIQG
jgi:hypothetical protein